MQKIELGGTLVDPLQHHHVQRVRIAHGTIEPQSPRPRRFKPRHVTESPLANSVTSWPSAISSSVSHDTTRSVPPYSFGGTLRSAGRSAQYASRFDLSFGHPAPRVPAQDKELQSDQMFQMVEELYFFQQRNFTSIKNVDSIGSVTGTFFSWRSIRRTCPKGTATFRKARVQTKRVDSNKVIHSKLRKVRKSYRH